MLAPHSITFDISDVGRWRSRDLRQMKVWPSLCSLLLPVKRSYHWIVGKSIFFRDTKKNYLWPIFQKKKWEMLFTVLIYHQHVIVAPIFFTILPNHVKLITNNHRFSRIVETHLLNDDNTGSYYYFISQIIIPCRVYLVVYYLIAYLTS